MQSLLLQPAHDTSITQLAREMDYADAADMTVKGSSIYDVRTLEEEGGRGFPKSRRKEERLRDSVCDKGEGVKESKKFAGVICGGPLRLRPTPVPVRLVNKSELSACAKLIGIFLYYRSPQKFSQALQNAGTVEF